MKKKYVAILMGIVMTAAVLGGCGQKNAVENDNQQTTIEAEQGDNSEEETEEILGEVTDVTENSITIAVGTKKEMERMEKPEGEPSEEKGEAPEGQPSGDMGEAPEGQPSGDMGEKPSMLELTGEEQTITITENTKITKSSMGKPENQTEESTGEAEQTISVTDIAVGDTVSISLDEDGNAATIAIQSMGMGGGPGMGGSPSQSQGVDSYEAVNEYKEDTTVEGETLSSTGTDENAVLVDSDATVTLKNVTVSRNSSDSTGGDNSSFYGVGAAVLGTEGNLYVSNSEISTDAAGGGTMVVDGGTYTSNGVGSPAVYCTADIAVNNSTLTANGSEAVCIEGLNTLCMYDCDITGNMSDDSQNDCTWTMIVYQSMSGDSEVGNSTLQIDGGSITSQNGGLLYTTNTECTITLKDVDITYNDDSEFFLQCTGNNNQRGWGQSGSNGSDCLFTAIEQEMKGNVIWDSISDLDFYMTEGSSLTGAVVKDETYAGNGGEGYCNLYIDKDSVWTVTGNSTVTSLASEGTIVDEDGKTVSIVGVDGTVYVEGDSEYTVTVESYSDTVDVTGATAVDEWENHEAAKPEEML